MRERRMRAGLRVNVSQRRPIPTVPGPMPAEAPAVMPGRSAYVHGAVATVSSVEGDHVLLALREEEDLPRFPPGLLVRWMGWCWRVQARLTHLADHMVVVESWGRSFNDSPKMAVYEE